jgi:alkanesulfonate monooxygenase SsuD/methylene tetrahydromethanopterin reductase-like flavin-dependent oxidoreductase (luciferase family)
LPVKVGIVLPVGDTDGPNQSTPAWPDIVSVARAAEDGGLDSVWVADHLFYRDPEGREYGLHEAWTILTGVAAVTSRVEVGTIVLCTSFRNAVLTAKMAAALDIVSDGRLVLGLGSGWHGPEYEAMGLSFPDRVSRFEESLEIIRRLLDGERLTMEGRFTSLRDAVVVPPPRRRIPILVAARRERMLGLTAKWADAWNTAWYGLPDERLAKALAAFDAALSTAGRTRDDVALTIGIEIRDSAQPPVAEPSTHAFDGDEAGLIDLLDAYDRLDTRHLIVVLEPMSVVSVERLAGAVRRWRTGEAANPRAANPRAATA